MYPETNILSSKDWFDEQIGIYSKFNLEDLEGVLKISYALLNEAKGILRITPATHKNYFKYLKAEAQASYVYELVLALKIIKEI